MKVFLEKIIKGIVTRYFQDVVFQVQIETVTGNLIIRKEGPETGINISTNNGAKIYICPVSSNSVNVFISEVK